MQNFVNTLDSSDRGTHFIGKECIKVKPVKQKKHLSIKRMFEENVLLALEWLEGYATWKSQAWCLQYNNSWVPVSGCYERNIIHNIIISIFKFIKALNAITVMLLQTSLEIHTVSNRNYSVSNRKLHLSSYSAVPLYHQQYSGYND